MMKSVTVLLLVLVRMTAAQSEIKCADIELNEQGNAANPEDACSDKFYSCPDAAEYAHERHCGANTLAFDPVSDKCLEPKYNALCPDGVATEEPVVEEPSDKPEEEPAFPFDCTGRRSGDYNHPNKPCSNLYASCAAGQLHIRECSTGLYFDAVSRTCLEKAVVKTCEVEGSEGQGDAVVPICEGKVDGFYALSCTDYVFCYAQEPFYQMCPKGLVFHPTINKCVEPSECTAPCGTKDVPPPFDCAGLPEGYYTRGDCSEYIFCEANGDPWTFECSPGYAFDVDIKECRPKTELPECVPTAASDSRLSWCARRINGLHAHPDDCHYAIVCLTGVAFELPCPTAELPRFDPSIGNCAGPTDECQADENQLNNVGVIVVDATLRGLVRRR